MQDQQTVSIDTWKAFDTLPAAHRDEVRAKLSKPVHLVGTTLDAAPLTHPDLVLAVNEGSPDGQPVPPMFDPDGFILRLRAPVVALLPADAQMVRDAIARDVLPKLGRRPLHITLFNGGVPAWDDIHRVLAGLGAKAYVERGDVSGLGVMVQTLDHTPKCINLIASATGSKDADLLIPAMWAWAEQRRAHKARQTSALTEVSRDGVVNYFPNQNLLVQRLRTRVMHAANQRGLSGERVEAQWRKLAEKAGLSQSTRTICRMTSGARTIRPRSSSRRRSTHAA